MSDPDPAGEAHPVGPGGRGPCDVVVATSFPALAEGLVSWLDDEERTWRVTTTCASGLELLEAVGQASIEVIVATDELGPPDLFREVHGRAPLSRMLVLTSTDRPDRDAALVRCGVLAVIPARSSRQETVLAVTALLDGRAVVSAEALRLVVAAPDAAGPVLTTRQHEVLELLAMGQTTAQIADRLFVTPSTVKTHFKQIGARLGVPGGQRALTANAKGLLDQQMVKTGAVSREAGFVSQPM